jgi:6-phosphogluconate dehydrogenase
MEIGMIGLGRMGANMARRLVAGGHRVVGFDPSAAAAEAARAAGVSVVGGMAAAVAALAPPRAVWVMVPAGAPTGETLAALAGLLQAGDVIVDGGNSHYRDSVQRASELGSRGIGLVDAGTSGGVWGLAEGYCLMLGGEAAAVALVAPAVRSLAPAPDRGWAHVGPSGAGHFVKMVHNGIEYGLMQAYAEGFELLSRKTQFGVDLAGVAELWRHGSVIRSWLLDLAALALAESPTLEGVAPRVEDSGEGRWSAAEALELGCPLPVITLALYNRFRSRSGDQLGDRLLAVLRQRFGGHAVARDG